MVKILPLIQTMISATAWPTSGPVSSRNLARDSWRQRNHFLHMERICMAPSRLSATIPVGTSVARKKNSPKDFRKKERFDSRKRFSGNEKTPLRLPQRGSIHVAAAISYRPAAFFRSAALLVASQVKSGSLRPKCPPLAVLR